RLKKVVEIARAPALFLFDPFELTRARPLHRPDRLDPLAPIHRRVDPDQPFLTVPYIAWVHLETPAARYLGGEGRESVHGRRFHLVHPHQLVGKKSKPSREGDDGLRARGQSALHEVLKHGLLFDLGVQALDRIFEAVTLWICPGGAERQKADIELVLADDTANLRKRDRRLFSQQGIN